MQYVIQILTAHICTQLSQVLASLLHHLRATSPEEKVVVVSNFTSTLDTVHTLLQGVGWGNVLRLDGKVPVDQRQALVNRYVNVVFFVYFCVGCDLCFSRFTQ